MLTRMLDLEAQLQSSINPIPICRYEIEFVPSGIDANFVMSTNHDLVDWLSIGLGCLHSATSESNVVRFHEILCRSDGNKLRTQKEILQSPLVCMETIIDDIYQELLGEENKIPMMGKIFIFSLLEEVGDKEREKELSVSLGFKDFYDTIAAQKAVLQLMKRVYIFNKLSLRTACVYPD